MPIFPAIGDRAVLAAIAAASAPYNGAKVQLFQANITPGPDTLLAAMTAATFTGYSLSAAVTWGTPILAPDALQKTVGVAKQFTQTDITTTNTVYGYVLVGDPSGTPYALASYRFASPASFTAAGNGVVVLPEVSLVQGGGGIVYSTLGQVNCLTVLSASGKYLDGAVVRLFKNNFSPNPASLLADFDEADFTGYAESAPVVWGVPYLDVDGIIKVTAGSVQYTQTGTGTTNTCYGWYLVGDPGGTEYLIGSERFDSPVSFTFTGAGKVVDSSFWMAQ